MLYKKISTADHYEAAHCCAVRELQVDDAFVGGKMLSDICVNVER